MKSQLEVALHQHKALEGELERSRAEAEQQVGKSFGHNCDDDDNYDDDFDGNFDGDDSNYDGDHGNFDDNDGNYDGDGKKNEDDGLSETHL